MPRRNRFQPALSTLAALVAGALLALTVAAIEPTEASAQCAVCDPCTTDGECGPGGVCVDFGDGTRVCSALCESQVCPGDSRCYSVDGGNGQTFSLCLNEGAPTQGVCPAGYQCGNARSCPSTGLSCANQGAMCGSDAEVCPADQNGAQFCSCFCNTDADCGTGNSCFEVDTRGVCVPGDGMTEPMPGCNGLGNPCTSCTADNDVCLSTTDGGDFCSCTCTTDADCGSTAGCEVVDPNAGTMACVPGTADLCADVQCAPDQICSPATGTCIGGSGDTSAGGDTASADTGGAGDTTVTTVTATTTPTTGGSDISSSTDFLLPGMETGGGSNTDASGGCCAAVRTQHDRPAPAWPVLVAMAAGLGWVVRRRR